MKGVHTEYERQHEGRNGMILSKHPTWDWTNMICSEIPLIKVKSKRIQKMLSKTPCQAQLWAPCRAGILQAMDTLTDLTVMSEHDTRLQMWWKSSHCHVCEYWWNTNSLLPNSPLKTLRFCMWIAPKGNFLAKWRPQGIISWLYHLLSSYCRSKSFPTLLWTRTFLLTFKFLKHFSRNLLVTCKFFFF